MNILKKKIISFFIILCIFTSCIFLFAHSTPQRAIRLHLLFDGYITDAFRTEILISNEEKPWKGKYYCINPSIGADFYAVKEGYLNLWFVDAENSGAC
ncbi:hypothetical protein BJV38_004881 [Clostridium beijerinckii]|uniref:hypothetical protein n=1 Tax=Clostridium beijerinckii TaxID=1520 RepID=UPI003242F890|nr:hypothetical protein [Clostridium beijerinckii]NRT48038.1 hypothetical protein [Clostridium beijerinckii]NRZ23665.1 hypothetical protein [Clostridium beijerinckii]